MLRYVWMDENSEASHAHVGNMIAGTELGRDDQSTAIDVAHKFCN